MELIKYENYRGGINNLAVCQIVDDRMVTVAAGTSLKGPRQAVLNARRNMRRKMMLGFLGLSG